jgi:hypothetical protein
VQEFTKLYLNREDNRFCFNAAVYLNGYVWLLPRFCEHAVKIDVKTDEVSIAGEFEPALPKGDDGQRDVCKYTFAQVSGGSIYAYNGVNGTFVEYNGETKARREEVIRYSPGVMARLQPVLALQRAMQFAVEPQAVEPTYHRFYYEDDAVRLSDYIRFVACEGPPAGAAAIRNRRRAVAAVTEITAHADGTSGAAIFEYCKEALTR